MWHLIQFCVDLRASQMKWFRNFELGPVQQRHLLLKGGISWQLPSSIIQWITRTICLCHFVTFLDWRSSLIESTKCRFISHPRHLFHRNMKETVLTSRVKWARDDQQPSTAAPAQLLAPSVDCYWQRWRILGGRGKTNSNWWNVSLSMLLRAAGSCQSPDRDSGSKIM